MGIFYQFQKYLTEIQGLEFCFVDIDLINVLINFSKNHDQPSYAFFQSGVSKYFSMIGCENTEHLYSWSFFFNE